MINICVVEGNISLFYICSYITSKGDKLSEALDKIGRNDVAENCLGPYINLDVTREQDDEPLPEVEEGEAEAFFGGKLDKQGKKVFQVSYFSTKSHCEEAFCFQLV